MTIVSQVQAYLPFLPIIMGTTAVLLIVNATMRLRSIVSQKRSLQAEQKVMMTNSIIDQIKGLGELQRLGADQARLEQARRELEQSLREYQSQARIEESFQRPAKGRLA